MSLIPKLSMNLMSVGQLTDLYCFIWFDDSSCYVQNCRTKAVIGIGHLYSDSSRLYVLDRLLFLFLLLYPRSPLFLLLRSMFRDLLFLLLLFHSGIIAWVSYVAHFCLL